MGHKSEWESAAVPRTAAMKSMTCASMGACEQDTWPTLHCSIERPNIPR